MVYELFTDGSVLNNRASVGFILLGDGGYIGSGNGIIEDECPIDSASAECFSILQGLSLFMRRWNQAGSLYVFNDCQYIVSQLNNLNSDNRLIRVVDSQIRQIKNYLPVFVQWIPRDKNQFADSLAKQMRSSLSLGLSKTYPN